MRRRIRATSSDNSSEAGPIEPGMFCAVASLSFGLVYDLFGSYPRRPDDPDDVGAEYEPKETLEVLEQAVQRLGHRPLRLGNPHALLAKLGEGELPGLDVALSIAEGHGGRNREAWAPVLLEMAEIPTLGSDALRLSVTLDKVWAHELVAASGVPHGLAARLRACPGVGWPNCSG